MRNTPSWIKKQSSETCGKDHLSSPDSVHKKILNTNLFQVTFALS